MTTGPNRDHLQRAFHLLAFRSVLTLDEALADPLRAHLVYTCATSLANREKAQAEDAERRHVVRPPEPTPSPSHTWWQPRPTHTTDVKRAAAGDLDD